MLIFQPLPLIETDSEHFKFPFQKVTCMQSWLWGQVLLKLLNHIIFIHFIHCYFEAAGTYTFTACCSGWNPSQINWVSTYFPYHLSYKHVWNTVEMLKSSAKSVWLRLSSHLIITQPSRFTCFVYTCRRISLDDPFTSFTHCWMLVGHAMFHVPKRHHG